MPRNKIVRLNNGSIRRTALVHTEDLGVEAMLKTDPHRKTTLTVYSDDGTEHVWSGRQLRVMYMLLKKHYGDKE